MWWWVLIGLALVLAALLVLGLLALRLWRQAKALARELSATSDRMAAVADRLSELSHAEQEDDVRSRH